MIKINLIAVGKLKEKYLRDACDEYVKRLGAFAKVNIIEIAEERVGDNPSALEIENVKKKEGERIMAKIPKGSFLVPLCIEGVQLSSEDFSSRLEKAMVDGFGEITFVIGGSFGMWEEIKKASNLKLSFGKMTLPHQLMRVVLLEQTYRCFTIINNIKYHK